MSFSIDIQGQGAHQIISLKDAQTGTVATFFSFGALLNSFKVHTLDGPLNVVDGFADPDDAIQHITAAFKSAKMSPFVCRLKNGCYQWNDEQLTVNSFFLGDHALHGLLYHAVYSIKDKGADASSAWVKLEHHYEGTDKGYPFAYTLLIKWELSARNCLTVTTTATNHSANTIPFSDGWHPYFIASESVDDCTIKFNSDRKLVFDADLLPTGAEEKDDRFLNGRSLQGITLDNSFVLPNDEPGYCELKSKQVRIIVEPLLHYPYLQVYTPEHRKSIAIENLSSAPDAFNNGMELVQLHPGEPKQFKTRYRVEIL